MLRILLLAAALSAASTAGAVQPVPEGIHSDGRRGDRICGLLADDIPAIEAQLAPVLERLEGNERFSAYADEANYRVWTFTTSAHPAHPAVACRSVVEGPEGVAIEMRIVCHSSRENCDALYREFERLHQQTVADLDG